MPLPSISNLYYKEEEKGKVIHSSKIHYIWGFTVNDVDHSIELIDSRLSTKKQIIINGKVLYKSEGQEYITKTFDLANHTFVLIPYRKRYELRVDGNPFKHLIMTENNKKVYNSSKTFQNCHIDEQDDEMPLKKTDTKLKVNRMFSFNIKPKVPKEEASIQNVNHNNNNNHHVSCNNIDSNNKDEEEFNLLDLDFNQVNLEYNNHNHHPYSSNNINFNFGNQFGQDNAHGYHKNYPNYNYNNNNNINQLPYKFQSNTKASNMYTISPIQSGSVIDFFD